MRKLDVTTTKSVWSKDDWVICKSDFPDPNEWISDQCGTAKNVPSTFPTSSPTTEAQKNCQFFFTEVADCAENEAYLEIKTTCPGMRISRDLAIVSWKEQGANCEVDLKGLVVPDDGYIIVCRSKIKHQYAYAGRVSYANFMWRDLSTCDVESLQLFNGHGSNSYAIKNRDNNCEKECEGSNCYLCNGKYLDIYGYPDATLEDTEHEYSGCRAVRKMKYPFGMFSFQPGVWEIVCDTVGFPSLPGEDCDPRNWEHVPMVLFFSEFCDPQDDKSKKFIELYSPNKRNYKIDEDIIVMKWGGSDPYPSHV